MKKGMSEIMFDDGTIEESIQAAAKIGYDGIELRPKPNHLPADIDKEQFAKVKKMIADSGLEVPCIACMPTSYLDATAEACRKQLETMKIFIGFAHELDCTVLRHWVGAKASRNATEADWETATTWVRKAADIAKDAGITLALELHHNTLIDGVDTALTFIDGTERDNIRLIHDAANLYQEDTEYGRTGIVKLKDKLQELHVKDIVAVVDESNPNAGGVYKGRRFVNRLINQGGVDQYSIFTGLKDIGFDGYAVVEAGWLSWLEPYEVAEYSFKAMSEIMDAVGL